MRCSNYIWVINNAIAHKGAPYIRDLTVGIVWDMGWFYQDHTRLGKTMSWNTINKFEVIKEKCKNVARFRRVGHQERIRQYDSSDTGHSDNVNIAAEHQEPAEVLSQLDNTSNSPVYGEYKCC